MLAELLLAITLSAAPALPDRVDLPTPTEARGAEHQVAVRDGKLWWSLIPTGEAKAQWALMPPDGLPFEPQKSGLAGLEQKLPELPMLPVKFVRPKRIERITADGDNLIAISSEGFVYYFKFSLQEWTSAWGPAGFRKPFHLDGKFRALAVSHRMTPYEDIDGNSHPVTVGVSTLYALDGDGRGLRYTDPWLPPAFERRICLPERGAFVAAALAASGSTLFVMDARGRMFTRLADFDTLGEDPALAYSYRREHRTGLTQAVRSLPPEDWKRQPPVPGAHTTRLAIRQVGLTNADRELTVEGPGGLWVRRFGEVGWHFRTTGVPMSGPATSKEAPLPPPGPVNHWVLTGTSTLFGSALPASLDWSFDCPPSPLTVGDHTLVLHTRRGSLFSPRETRFKGALMENDQVLALVEVQVSRGPKGFTLRAFKAEDADRTRPVLEVQQPR